MNFITLLIIFLSFESASIAQDVSPVKQTLAKHGEGAEFQIESDLVDKIYNQSLEQSRTESQLSAKNLTVSPSFNYVQIDSLQTNSDYFNIQYEDSVSAMSQFSIQFAQKLDEWNNLIVKTQQELGYAYIQDLIATESVLGVEGRDNITFQQIPVSLAISVLYRLTSKISPELYVGAGNSFLQQTGKLDGLSQSVWVPFTKYGVQVNFSDLSSEIGFFVGFSRVNSFEDRQKFDLTQANIGATVVL